MEATPTKYTETSSLDSPMNRTSTLGSYAENNK